MLMLRLRSLRDKIRIIRLQRNLPYKPQNIWFGYQTRLFRSEVFYFGDNVYIGNYNRIEAIKRFSNIPYQPILEFGAGSSMQDYCHIAVADSVTIGKNVLMASRVFITDHNHGYRDVTKPPAHQKLSVKKVLIEDNCWLGEGSVVLPGTHLGVGCVVGANAVVKGDIPPYSVVVGNPGRVIKQYHS